jgi:hypothetical protein
MGVEAERTEIDCVRTQVYRQRGDIMLRCSCDLLSANNRAAQHTMDSGVAI